MGRLSQNLKGICCPAQVLRVFPATANRATTIMTVEVPLLWKGHADEALIHVDCELVLGTTTRAIAESVKGIRLYE